MIQYRYLAVNFTDTDTDTDNCYAIYAPSELAMSDCSIRVFYYEMTVLLEYLNLNTNLQLLSKQIFHFLC